MKILLTGATGFTGRHFLRTATAAGHQVQILAANLTDKEAVRQQVAEAAPEAVVHLAAISFVSHADDNAFYAVNVLGTMNLLSALAELPRAPRRVLLASSGNVYGNCAVSPISESQLPAPINHYAMSKLAMEHMAKGYFGRLPLVIARPFNYTGPGQSVKFLIPKLVDHFDRRAPSIALGNLHVEREFNDVQMVCDVYLQLLQHGEPGECYNICSGQPHTLQHLVDTLVFLTSHEIRVEVNPAFVRPNEVHRLCGDPAKLDALLAAHGTQRRHVSLEQMLERMLYPAKETGKAKTAVIA